MDKVIRMRDNAELISINQFNTSGEEPNANPAAGRSSAGIQ